MMDPPKNQCKITVLRDPNGVVAPRCSDLHRHLGKLLQNQAGADVTFMVSGESIPAHKIILAARSPVFMAQFFGSMVERSSPCVEIQDMDPTVFKAMIHYIYTDKLSNLSDKQPEAEVMMVQNLLVAADRYGLDKLKAICEHRLCCSVGVAMVALTLALAEQHSCSELKARCVEFIAGGSGKTVEAILSTEGYRNLEASSPSVVTELFKAAHRKWEKSALTSTGPMS